MIIKPGHRTILALVPLAVLVALIGWKINQHKEP